MRKKYNVNNFIFSGPLDEEKAYWIGFIAADGCVGKDNRIQVKLKEQDYRHIEKFKKFLNYDGIIEKRSSQLGKSIRKKGLKKYYNVNLVRAYSPKICEDLKQYGIVRNKSLILKFPENIPHELIRHYIRGYIDGDGCWSSDNQKYPTMTLTIVSTKEFLKKINEIFISNGLVKQFNKIKSPSKIYALAFGGNKQIKKIAEWLYYNSNTYLDRKKKYLVDNNIIDENGKSIIKVINKNGKNNSNAKKYKIISPDKKEHIVHGNLRQFCNDKNLWYAGILDVRFGRRKECNGWTCSLII